MQIENLDFDVPEGATAQRPAASRDGARMLVAPAGGTARHESVTDLPRHFRPGEVLVLNDTRVRPVRLPATKDTGGRAEILLVARRADGTWLALVKASRSPVPGSVLVAGSAGFVVLGRQGEAFVLRSDAGDPDLEAAGLVPLPPYIRRPADAQDAMRYQCVYARSDLAAPGTPGASAAAPTAGLHLTAALLDGLERDGVEIARLALGVGLGTFRAIEAARVEDHLMHEEPFEIGPEAAAVVERALRDGRRVTAVGTTSLRALEAAATPRGRIRAVSGSTGLFVVPGSRLRTATRLLTNFHQPRTTLLALVQAFGGTARVRSLYAEAVRDGYRLFSYGDCMLLERAS